MDWWDTVHVLEPRLERVLTRAAQRYERRRRALAWDAPGSHPQAVAQARRLVSASMVLSPRLVDQATREP